MVKTLSHDWRNHFLWRLFASVWAALSATVICTFSLVLSPFMGAKRAFFATGRFWVRQQFFMSGIRYTVEGWDALPDGIKEGKQPVLFMCNHASLLDPPFLMEATPIPSMFMAKKEVRYFPGVGWASWAAGFIFVDRGNNEKAMATLKKATKTLLKGTSVTLFPEGTRSKDGELAEFKKGGFFLAVKTGVPIVPVAVHGTYHILSADSLLLRPGRITAAFGEPIHPKDFPRREALVAETHRRVAILLDRLKQAT